MNKLIGRVAKSSFGAVFGIVVKLLDRLVRKAIYEPRGWCCHPIVKGVKSER